MKKAVLNVFLTFLVGGSLWAQDSTIFMNQTVFVPKTIYASGSENWSVAVGDINKDGKIDVVTASRLDGKVNIHLNDGKGNFGKPYSYGTAKENRALCLFDANGDGWLDIATVSTIPGQLATMLNDGTGRMKDLQLMGSGLMSHDVTPADVTGDGKPDLLVPVVNENVIKVFVNDGNGSFKLGNTIATSEKPRVVKLADLDGNGTLDMVVGCDEDKIYIHAGEGGGKFKPKSAGIRSGLAVWGLEIADFNNDGKLDIATASYQDGKLCIHLSNGGMTFKKEQIIQACDRNFDMVVKDFDMDKDLDIVVCSTIDENIGVSLNDGKGIFGKVNKMKSGNWNAGIDAADFDGDGDIDIAVASIKDNSLNIHKNKSVEAKQKAPEDVCVMGKVWNDEKNVVITKGVISLLNEKAEILTTKPLESDGSFKFCTVKNKKYQLQVRTEGFPPTIESFEMVDKNVEKDVHLKLPNGGSVCGVVSDADSRKGIPTAKLTIYDDAGKMIVELNPNSNGAYKQLLPFGSYKITAIAERYNNPSSTFTITQDNREKCFRQDILMTKPKDPNMPEEPKVKPKPKPKPKPTTPDVWGEPDPKPEEPKETGCIVGRITNAKTGESIADAEVVIADKFGFGGENKNVRSGSDGNYKSCQNGGEFKVSASARGFFFASADVTVTTDNPEPVQADIALTPLEVGEKITLNNIYFDTGKSTLRDESYSELDRLTKIMEENPTLSIEIGGHTDSDGSDASNMRLSKNRAQAVVDYLSMKGIGQERMQAKGYGESQPVAPNDTPENKQLNRRNEVMVMGF